MISQTSKKGSATAVKENRLFGDWLVQQGSITDAQLQTALEEQAQNGGRIGQTLVRLKILNDSELTQQLASTWWHLRQER